MNIIYLFLLSVNFVSGFSILSRRDALAKSSMIIATIVAPDYSLAFSQQLDDNLVEPSQLPTNGKIDLNNAFIGEYMQFRGMYPTAAGKIASNGPYKKVSDIYDIKGLTPNDKMLFLRYEENFTVNPPGRAFKERINGRVST